MRDIVKPVKVKHHCNIIIPYYNTSDAISIFIKVLNTTLTNAVGCWIGNAEGIFPGERVGGAVESLVGLYVGLLVTLAEG